MAEGWSNEKEAEIAAVIANAVVIFTSW